MQIKSFTFNPLQENTYVLYDQTKECIVVDPGCYEAHEQRELADFVADNGLTPVRLLNTHCHVDHVLGNYFVGTRYNLKVETSVAEVAQLRSVKLYAPMYGLARYSEFLEVQEIGAGAEIKFGNTQLNVLFVPGHSPGHLAFWNQQQGVCIVGDVVFRGSVGRTDLPGGNFSVLEQSIREVIYKLPDDTVLYPGHGPETSVGFEKKYNPFVRG